MTETDVSVKRLLRRWLAEVDETLDDAPGPWDASVRIGARWEKGDYSRRFKEALETDEMMAPSVLRRQASPLVRGSSARLESPVSSQAHDAAFRPDGWDPHVHRSEVTGQPTGMIELRRKRDYCGRDDAPTDYIDAAGTGADLEDTDGV